MPGIVSLAGNASRYFAAGGGVLSLPLVQESDDIFSYLGSFNGPNTTGGNPGSVFNYDFQYGGNGMSIHEGSIYMSSYKEVGLNIGKFTIPALDGTGTTTIEPVMIPGTFASDGNPMLTGSLVYGGEIYMTAGIVYDATGIQEKFLVKANLALDTFGSPCAASGDEGNDVPRLYASQMGHVPVAWQDLLGGPAFILGGCGLSVQSQLCNGFGFSTFDPAAVVPGNPVALTEWTNYPYVHTLAGRTGTNSKGGDDYVSPYDGAILCGWIHPGSRSLLILSTHQYGPSAARFTDPCDPGGQASGSNETPTAPDTLPYCRMQVTAYDLAEVISNKNTGGDPWDVLPYAFWEFPDWRTLYGDCVVTQTVYKIGGAQRDIATGKLYLGFNFNDLVEYFVFDTVSL